MTTVRELMEILGKIDPDRVVVLASDFDDSSFLPMDTHWISAYKRGNTGGRDAGLGCLTKDDEEMGSSEEDVVRGGVPAIILVPSSRYRLVERKKTRRKPPIK
jgi:hypothetical protein